MGILVKNLIKSYGKQIAVDDISFEISKGEIVGFIGPNGSGKTTTMKAISGILKPDSGVIKCNEVDIVENPVKAKASIGYLPENNPLYPDMYVKEYLEFCANLFGLTSINEKINKIISETGLEKERNKKIEVLSKGYRQRVGLAQALIHNPDILILDEPTTGLDPNQILEIRQLISSISEEKTVLLSTHILQEVEAICDRIILINRGKLIIDDKTSSMRDSLNSEKQIVYVEFKEDIRDETVRAIKFISEFKKLSNKEYIFEGSSDSEDVREEIFKWARDSHLHILSLQNHKETLEETFRKLTSGKK